MTGQSSTSTSSSAKYGCATCEDFGMVIVGDGHGTVLCTVEGCAAAERLRRQQSHSATEAEPPVSGTAPESRQ